MANNQGKRLTSTIGYTYFGTGADGEDKAMSIGYLDNNLSIGIFGLLPKSQQTANQKYDYKSGSCIYLKGKQAKMLARLVKNAAKRIINGDSVESSAISSADNLIEVADGKKYGMEQGVTIAVYTGINPDKTSSKPATFQFRNDKLIGSYNHESGTYEDASIDADIDYFIDQVSEFAKGITAASAHCIKKEMSFDMSRVMSRQIQMCQALGIQQENSYTSRASWGQQQTSQRSMGNVANMNTEDLLNELEEA